MLFLNYGKAALAAAAPQMRRLLTSLLFLRWGGRPLIQLLLLVQGQAM